MGINFKKILFKFVFYFQTIKDVFVLKNGFDKKNDEFEKKESEK